MLEQWKPDGGFVSVAPFIVLPHDNITDVVFVAWSTRVETNFDIIGVAVACTQRFSPVMISGIGMRIVDRDIFVGP
jgi:hypothetical protein